MSEIVNDGKNLLYLRDNFFVGQIPVLENSTITIKGRGNILISEKDVRINDSKIIFEGNNSIVFLSASNYAYRLDLQVYSESIVAFGKNNYFNSNVSLIVSEGKNFLCGKECLFAKDIRIRTSDHHLIYDIETSKRINYGKSVYIGDNCWICEDSKILKGVIIGSGTIVGAGSLVSMRKLRSNEMWGGIPVKCIKKNVCFLSTSPVKWTEQEILQHDDLKTNNFVFEKKLENEYVFEEIEEKVRGLNNQAKCEFIINLFENSDKNRFAF